MNRTEHHLKRNVIWAAIIGFAMPIFWGILGFIFFTAPESVWTDLFWDAVHITCPFWNLSGTAGMFALPFLNAMFYAIIAVLFNYLRHSAH